MDCKTCKTCGIEKPLSEFYKGQKYKNTQYYRSYCKLCSSIECKKYHKDNREKNLELQRRWREKNPDYSRRYRETNYEKEKERWTKNNAIWRKLNPKYPNEYDKKRKQSDPLYKLSKNVRSLISHGFAKKRYQKNTKTQQILGCSFEEFISHLEKQFNSGITWENYGKWHLDHIVPVSLASTEEEIIKLNHYKNFQPMWGPENNSKNDKIIHEMITPELQEKYKEILQRTQPA